jgi:hypothetical protein
MARQGHKLNAVGCLHEKATSSSRGDAGVYRHRLKAYSLYNVLDVQGESFGQGRIDHARPEDFRALVRRWPGSRVVFEAGMNWHGLFEILARELSSERIVLANPFKTRIIAEAQIKDRQVGRADSGRSVTRQAGPQRAYRRSGVPTDQGGASPALFFHAPAHHVAQSHPSSAWRSARSEVAAMQRPLRPQGV